MIKLLVGIPLFLAIGSFILNAVLALLLTFTYSALTKESIVATIKFDEIPDQQKVYIAHLYSDNGSKIGDYTIYGDQWRIDAGFIKMEYLANILGIDSKYTLNRFEGRYENIQDENNQKHKAYLLETHKLIDVFSFFIDTRYGSSVYQDIKLNTKYIVLKTQTGLMVREQNMQIVKEKGFMDNIKDAIGY